MDVASAHTALKAYQSYLTNVVQHEPAWKSSANAYVATVRAQCPNVLAGINALPQSKVNQGASTAFGEELGFDVELTFLSVDTSYQAALGRALSHLRWSSRSTGTLIKNWQSATNRLFHLATSALCADAQALANDNAQATPPGTLGFLNQFERATVAVARGANKFQQALVRFGAKSDRRLVQAVNHLLIKVSTAERNDGVVEARKLGAALGLTS